MKLLSLLTIVTLIGFAQFAYGYGAAGCGLGAVLFQENTFISQSSAASSNGYTAPLAITSGTSECKAQNFVLNEKKAEYFAEANYQELSNEMASGQGEKLNVLAKIYNCENTKVFSQAMQTHYSEVFPSEKTSAVEMVQNIKSIVKIKIFVTQISNLKHELKTELKK